MGSMFISVSLYCSVLSKISTVKTEQTDLKIYLDQGGGGNRGD